MILATILESIPWCHVVVGILFMGSWTRDSPYLPHVDSVASSFRILVTFALVLEVRGISFFQILWTTYGRSLLDQKITTRVLLMSSPFCIVNLPVLPFCMGCPEEMLSFARHTNLCIHNSENYMFLELFLFSCIPTIFYQLIAKSMCAFVFIDAYYSCGPSSHSIPEWLGETNSSTSSISRIGSK